MVRVEVTYEHPGTTPPIFIASSFTDAAWHPIELEYEKINNQFMFFRSFNVDPGTHRYKFRVGHGDWWICDDSKQTGEYYLWDDSSLSSEAHDVVTASSASFRD